MRGIYADARVAFDADAEGSPLSMTPRRNCTFAELIEFCFIACAYLMRVDKIGKRLEMIDENSAGYA